MFTNNADFYPTPDHLITKMLEGIKLKELSTVLEPSAGKGNIAKALKEKFEEVCRYSTLDLDVIEVDPNLRHILKGENFKVVHDDFLTYTSYKSYDLIMMNPPFSNGDRHLLKALEMQERGGRVVCLLNAETLRNPYSNTRKALVRKLEEYNASIEYLEDTFLDAERKTGVEIALIKVKIPVKKQSIIIEGLKREEYHEPTEESWSNDVVIGEFLERIVSHYNFEVKAGVSLIREFKAASPMFLTSLGDKSVYNREILNLTINGNDHCRSEKRMINEFIKSVRYKYWNALFSSEQFTKLFTSKLRSEYADKIKDLENYDFSLYNIYTIQYELSKTLLKSVEDTIIELFDELSHEYSYYDETSRNIHYYDGWKTNKSWKINKKVIIPLSAYSSWSGRYECNDYRVKQKLSDIEKALCYLDGGAVNHEEMDRILTEAQNNGTTAKIQLKYFTVTFYKKGTCHIQFTNLPLLDKLNLYGSQKKGWLPPSYGKKEYEDMTVEEQQVIDSFQGKDAYENILKEKAYYLAEHTPLSFGLPELPVLPSSTAANEGEAFTPVSEDSELMFEQKDIENTVEVIEHPVIIEVQNDEKVPAEVIEVIETNESDSSIVIDVEPEMECEVIEVAATAENISEEMNDNQAEEVTIVEASSVEIEPIILTEDNESLKQDVALQSEQLLFQF